MPGLPVVAERGDRALIAVGDEDRVVAEALAAARLVRNASRQRACAPKLRLLGRQGDELAHVARAPARTLDAPELGEQPADGIVPAGPGRCDAGAAAEPLHLDAGVLAEHPGIRLRVR